MKTFERRAELERARRPFVQATVVRAEQPTSARPGDQAIITEDGRMEGFVGGQCTVASVKVAAMDALRDRQALLLRVLPDGAPEFPPTAGACVVVNPCLSGGSVEIYLEPVLPAPVLCVTGESPIARAIARIGSEVGYAVTLADDGAPLGAATAVIVSRHGGAEAADIRAALDAGALYVGLVASHARGSSVLSELTLTEEERARVHTPAGLPIGATTPEEIAVSIIAEIVSVLRTAAAVPAARSPAVAGGGAPELLTIGSGPSPTPEIATDPVCGMSVVVAPDAIHLRIDGEDHYFCRTGCRERFAAERGVEVP